MKNILFPSLILLVSSFTGISCGTLPTGNPNPQSAPSGANSTGAGGSTSDGAGTMGEPNSNGATTSAGGTGTSTGGTTTGGTTMGGSTRCGVDTWTNYAENFFATQCVTCHIHDHSALNTYANVVSDAATITTEITSGDMPKNMPLAAADKTRILAWINCKLPQ